MGILEPIWQDFLDIVRQEVGSRVVETWLKAVTLEQWDEQSNTAYVQAPNSFIKDWISSNYLPLFHEHLARLFAVKSMHIVFTSNNNTSATTEVIVPARRAAHEHKTIHSERATNQPLSLNDTYAFNTFFVGQSNALMYAAAHAIVEKPGLLYNPLFLCGGPGLGKTHVLNAIGNEIKQRFKRLSVLYQPADRFVSEFINAIRTDKVDVFKERYEQLDVLIIDDIQFIAHKEQTQETFFYIFNSLYEASKQIVCSCDTLPQNLRGFSERLRSRLQGGLVIDVHPPTVEEKMMIIQRKAEQSQVTISTDLAHAIALQTNSIREVEGSLIRICAVAALTNQSVTLDLAQKVLQRSLAHTPRKIGLYDVAYAVSKQYNCNISQLRSKVRNKDITLARQVAMYLMKQLTGQSLQSISRYLNRKNHSTVVHAINKVQKLIKTNQDTGTIITNVQAVFQR